MVQLQISVELKDTEISIQINKLAREDAHKAEQMICQEMEKYLLYHWQKATEVAGLDCNIDKIKAAPVQDD